MSKRTDQQLSNKIPTLVEEKKEVMKKLSGSARKGFAAIVASIEKKEKVIVENQSEKTQMKKKQIEKGLADSKKRIEAKKKKKVAKKKVAKKSKDSKKEPPKETTKDQIYKMYTKVKPENAKSNIKIWHEKFKDQVKLNTIRGWVSTWKNGKGLPRIAKRM